MYHCTIACQLLTWGKGIRKMRDKERILMIIISRIIPGLTSCTAKKEDYIRPFIFNTHEFMVGFVHEVKSDCVVIREIGSKKLCNYYNETFSVINKEKLGYEILEGVQYKTYQKVLKAFSKYTSYSTRFRSIEFSSNTCTVTSRIMFKNDKNGEISFEYNQKTKISDIGKLLEKAGL